MLRGRGSARAARNQLLPACVAAGVRTPHPHAMRAAGCPEVGQQRQWVAVVHSAVYPPTDGPGHNWIGNV